MKILLLKASSDYWYKIITVNDLEELFKIIKKYKSSIILNTNEYKHITEKDMDFWEGLTIEDVKRMNTIDYQITIYDDYIE